MWSIFSRNVLNSFPYEIGYIVAEIRVPGSVTWKQYKGKTKNGEEVSIFIGEGDETAMDHARGAVKRLKTLRHPSILKYIDSQETDKSVLVVTESVIPHFPFFRINKKTLEEYPSVSAWGLLQVMKGLSFINNDAKLSHNSMSHRSIFITPGGDWKIFGFEFTSTEIPSSGRLGQFDHYDPPEITSGSRKKGPLWSHDAWGLGCLVWETFNDEIKISQDLEDRSKIPKLMDAAYIRLVCANPLSRPNPQDVIDKLRKPKQYFTNDLIETMLFLEEIQIKDDKEKQRFLSGLTSKLDTIPMFICENTILPALLKIHEFSNVGSVILTPLFKIGSSLSSEKYQSLIVPCVVRMFSSTDRATRLCLLQQIETMSEHLDEKVLNDHIFPHFVTGFHDTNPTIREQTVKAILYIAPKLNYQNLNVEILKHFARLQSKDDQGGIRTNTTVCLGKIATHLHPTTRQKCLASAFTRAMRDPFSPARIAGITAVGATQQFYPLADVAGKLLPSMCRLMLDPEKSVRDASFKIIKGFIGKLEKVSEDSSLQEVMEKEVSSASDNSTVSTWSGWAVGALTSKFYKSSLITTNASAQKESATSDSTGSMTAVTPTLPSILGSADHLMSQLELEENDTEKSKDVSEDDKHHTNAAFINDDLIDEDGWADNEEWGSLEDCLLDNSKSKDSKPVVSSSNYGWKSSESSDFFSSIEAKMPVKSSKPCSKGSTSDWSDDWADTPDKDDPFNLPLNDSKLQRDEKRAQRQKEILAKRANKAGPMKLGARKF